MNKIILAGTLLLAGVTASFAGDSWGKLSLFDTAAYPQVSSVRGGELGLVYSNTQNLTGVQFTFLYGRLGSLDGVQLGAVTSADKATGIQFGLVNMTKDTTGAQLGAVNYAAKLNGFQLGFVNYVESMSKGLQIGLVNVIRNSKLPFMVFVNGRF